MISLEQLILELATKPEYYKDSQFYLGPDELIYFKDRLLNCIEFRNVTGIGIVNDTFPTSGNETKCVDLKSYKINSGDVLLGNVIIHSIQLTPEVFSYENIIKSEGLTPLFFENLTYTPISKIIVNVCHEKKQCVDSGCHVCEWKDYRQSLIDKFIDILDNPGKHKIKGKRGIIIRGILNIQNETKKEN